MLCIKSSFLSGIFEIFYSDFKIINSLGFQEQDNYEDADCQEVEDEEEAGNEVEVIEDSSEVPNQSERSIQEETEEENSEQPQSEAISSGTDGE